MARASSSRLLPRACTVMMRNPRSTARSRFISRHCRMTRFASIRSKVRSARRSGSISPIVSFMSSRDGLRRSRGQRSLDGEPMRLPDGITVSNREWRRLLAYFQGFDGKPCQNPRKRKYRTAWENGECAKRQFKSVFNEENSLSSRRG